MFVGAEIFLFRSKYLMKTPRASAISNTVEIHYLLFASRSGKTLTIKMRQSLSKFIDKTEKNRELGKALELRKIERTMQQNLEEKKSKLYVVNDWTIFIYDFLVEFKKRSTE